MSGIFNTIISLVVALFISGGVSTLAEETPEDAVNDFFNGLTGGDHQVFELYMDNSYINFFANVKGSDEEMDRLEGAIFSELEWEITDTATKNHIAVCRVTVKNSNFSNVLDAYERESHKYVMDNLYNDKVTDKERLNKACMDMYLEQIEKVAETGETCGAEIFIPMEDNGYNGWRIILDDSIMEAATGGLVLPIYK